MAKILLVEDDPMISEIYQTKFRSSGFEVELAETGRAVLQKALAEKFDLILLDLVLPEMGGLDVLKELRTNPAYDPNLKIIVFSNLNEREDHERAIELGANGFIPKTEYSPSRLVEELQRFLRQFEEQARNDNRSAEDSAPVRVFGKSILFIEDETVFTDMFGGRLEQEGYVVSYLDGGPDKVRSTLGTHFDLVITDMAIRGMTGKDVIEEVHRSEVNAKTPIILFSASVDDSRMEEEKNYGATKYYLKTRLTPTELVREVNALLGVE